MVMVSSSPHYTSHTQHRLSVLSRQGPPEQVLIKLILQLHWWCGSSQIIIVYQCMLVGIFHGSNTNI